jgi:hypothetical protein
VGLTSLIAGLAGYTLARTGSLYMPYTLVTRVPTDRQLVAARQPRAAGDFLVVCLILGGVGAAILLGTIADMGLSAIEAALVLDTAMIYAAWRLLLRPPANAPQP